MTLLTGCATRVAKPLVIFLLFLVSAACTAQGPVAAPVMVRATGVRLTAGALQRQLTFDQGGLRTSQMTLGGKQILSRPAEEIRFRVQYASPDRKPGGLKPGEGGSIDTTAVDASTNQLSVHEESGVRHDGVTWLPAPAAKQPQAVCKRTVEQSGSRGLHHLTVKESLCDGSLSIALHYEIYDGYPAIRKWLEVKNVGRHWLKLDRLMLEDFDLTGAYRHKSALTPSERGAVSSLVAMSSEDESSGVILGSEIPSALRNIEDSGAMTYTDEYFEWVLGPMETFQSEPVFEYAFSGQVLKTVSSRSTPLDRTIETTFQHFLRERIGVLVDASSLPVPYFSTWSNFGANLNDATLRELAGLAAQAGFGAIVIDDGWQRGRLGTEVDRAKFPDFAATTRYILSKGLRVGLWVSTFRSPDSIDLRDLPDAASRPAIKRAGGFGMAFASPWREYYARDLARLSRAFGASYFKQDFSNLRFGDLAEGHESRTIKESLLRGLRGLLQAQDEVRKESPGITLELTHEVYWGTPGVPCDLAALKHVNLYHVPPNDYSGDGNRAERYRPDWTMDRAAMQRGLLEGALHARERLYAHRGLPLDAIEYYGAATMNIHGSLTQELQDRQIVSWLMGAPMVFSGDLASLTQANLDHYRSRFELLKHLQETYNIYDFFEFSGVPSAPTDKDWQWWGKLNANGYGAVVVLRGEAGDESRAINIPWVETKTEYEVRSLFNNRTLGHFSGHQLYSGQIHLSLPINGQEILELSPVRD